MGNRNVEYVEKDEIFMIEMRWLLITNPHGKLGGASDYTLQYRYWKTLYNHPSATVILTQEWSDWIDVPYVSEDKE